jgi:hypothetical protein
MKAKRRHRKQLTSEHQTERKSFFSQGYSNNESQFFKGNIQAKLTIGSSADQHEKQADQVASRVVRGESLQRKEEAKVRKQEEEEVQTKLQKQEEEEMQTKLQRQSESKGEEEELQAKLQRQEEEEAQTKVQKQEEEEVQAKSIQRKELTASTSLESRINLQKGGGNPLPEDLRKDLEIKMNASFRHVRIHNDNAANKLCEELNALAFTVGNHIFFRSGRYQPGTSTGKELLAHELTHVLQQRNSI